MKNKKILITGACGFIGSHLTEYLLENGYEVVAFDRYNINNHYGCLNTSKYKDEINFILGDIRDYDSVNNAIKDCSVVFHLAALIGIPYSYISPLAYLKTNVEGTYNVLEASKNHGLEQILITSTSETYGSAQYLPIDEKHPLNAQSPYAASKIAADQLALSYYRSFELPIKVLKPFNVFGPRQSTRAVIPTIITQILKKKDFLNIGNLSTKRDFTFIFDACYAFLCILKSTNLYGEVTNIGMNKNISIQDLVNLISSKLNYESQVKVEPQRVRPHKSEVIDLLCNNEKLLNSTPWNPKFDFLSGLDKTIEWMNNNIDQFSTKFYHV